MRLLWRYGLGLLLLTALVWAVTIVYWQESHRAVTPQDVAVNLVALPVALFAAFLLLRFGIDAMKAPVAAAAPAGAAPTKTAAPVSAAAERAWAATVLAANAVNATGASAAAIAGAHGDGPLRVGLDPELKDDAGLPIFAARVPQLDLASIESALEALRPGVAARREAWAGALASPGLVRALALLESALQPLAGDLERVTPWLLEPPEASTPHTRRVQVLLAVPPAWSDFDSALAQAWLAAHVSERWATPLAWPTREGENAVWQTSVHPATTGEAFLLRLDKLLTLLRQQEHEDLVLALAADSSLDDTVIESLAARGELFRAETTPQGVMPGEAAAALLLAPGNVITNTPTLAHADAPRLTRLALRERDKPAGAAGRISGQCLGDAIGDALAAASCTGAAVGRLVSDLDHRGSRSGELYPSLPALLAGLDAATDVWPLGVGAGVGGVADSLVALAVASVPARADAKPVLVATVSHPTLRAAALLLPAAWLPLPPQPPAAAAPA
jgi:hypothetical protein